MQFRLAQISLLVTNVLPNDFNFINEMRLTWFYKME